MMQGEWNEKEIIVLTHVYKQTGNSLLPALLYIRADSFRQTWYSFAKGLAIIKLHRFILWFFIFLRPLLWDDYLSFEPLSTSIMNHVDCVCSLKHDQVFLCLLNVFVNDSYEWLIITFLKPPSTWLHFSLVFLPKYIISLLSIRYSSLKCKYTLNIYNMTNTDLGTGLYHKQNKNDINILGC